MKTDLQLFNQRVGEATSEDNDAGWGQHIRQE